MRTFDEFIKYLIFREFNPATVIDVGACWGTPELFRNLPNAYHIFIEPIPELEDRLKLLAKKFRGEYHLLAAGKESGSMRLTYSPRKPEGGTLTGQAKARKGDYTTIDIRIETLDNLFAARGLTSPIVLKTDCQGFDLDVLMGGRALLDQVEFVISEVNMFHAAGDHGRPVFGDVVAWMRDAGFAVFDIVSYNLRPLDKALGYVDLAFVRRDSRFWATHRWA